MSIFHLSPKTSTQQSSSKGELYEKPHLVVDFKPIEEAKLLLEECEAFITLSNQSLVVLPFPGLSRIRKWREKRRDDQLASLYANLQKRVQESERVLRNMIGDIVEKKRALRLQGRYLIARLDACMTFNCDMLSESDNPVVDIRALVNSLSSASVQVKSMMVFNNEVLRQRSVQAVRHGKSFMPWTKRTPVNRAVTEAELSADEDHPMLQRRLHDLREARGKFMEFLANSLESRETYTSNLENCATSKQMLQALLQRDSIKDEPGTEAIPPFEHSRCTDCSYARAITSDCIDHLTALHNQAMTASKRLQQLVEAREQMRDLAESMDLSDVSKFAADDSAIGALEGTGSNYRSLPSYISPRSPPSSPASHTSASSSSTPVSSPVRVSSIEKARQKMHEENMDQGKAASNNEGSHAHNDGKSGALPLSEAIGEHAIASDQEETFVKTPSKSLVFDDEQPAPSTTLSNGSRDEIVADPVPDNAI